jgi:hypothetical protein
MSNERIDLTQFEKMIETANAYMGRWFKGTVLPSGDEWRSINDLGLHVDWSHNEVFGPLVEEFPSLIAELKRCYEEIDNLVKEKNRLIDIAERGGAWDGGIDISDINEKYGACNLCGSIPSGCCEEE